MFVPLTACLALDGGTEAANAAAASFRAGKIPDGRCGEAVHAGRSGVPVSGTGKPATVRPSAPLQNSDRGVDREAA
jgi:hypothetical protein